MKLFWALTIAGIVVFSAAPEALVLLQQPPVETDEGMNPAGWGNILWAAIAVVALVMFVSLALFGLRSTRRSRIGD